MGLLFVPSLAYYLKKNGNPSLLDPYISWSTDRKKLSENPEPYHIRDYNHDTYQHYQDLKPAHLTNTKK
jgi:hypothetical protein